MELYDMDVLDDEDMSKPWDEGDCFYDRNKLLTSDPNTHSNSIRADEAATKRGDPAQATMLALNDNKAGMEGLDKERINQIIYETSKGSKFYLNEKRKERQVNDKILIQERQLKKLNAQQIAHAVTKANAMLAQLESRRDLTQTIVHVDMDAFYAAVEILDRPDLADRPMAVGGSSMLSTSNYAARRYGVRAGMPGFIARKLCPSLVILPCNFAKYEAMSERVRSIFADYDPNYSPMSLDEAYLNITQHLEKRRLWTYKELVKEGGVGDKECRSGGIDTLGQTEAQECAAGEIGNNPGDPSMQEWCTGSEFDQGERVEDVKCKKMLKGGRIVKSGRRLKGFKDPQIVCRCETEKDVSGSESGQDLEEFDQELDKRTDQGHSCAELTQSCSLCHKIVAEPFYETFGVTAEEAVREMRFRIYQETFLTASAGIAPNTMLAKVCSDKNKPNGQYRIQPTREAVTDFMRDLPIRKIPGIGKVTEAMLKALDVITCSQLYERRGVLQLLYSQLSFEHFMSITLGISSSHLEPKHSCWPATQSCLKACLWLFPMTWGHQHEGDLGIAVSTAERQKDGRTLQWAIAVHLLNEEEDS